MSFEDIEVGRAARAAREVIKGKGRCIRKRKSATLEAVEPETEVEAVPEVAHAAKEVITGKRKQGWKRKSACTRGKGGGTRARARSGTDDRSVSAMESTNGTYVLKRRSRGTGSLGEE